MNKLSRTWRSTSVSLRSVITGSNFWIAIILVFSVLFAEIAEEIFSGYWKLPEVKELGAAYSFNISLHFGYFIYAAPLACAFASSSNLVNDVEAGFYRLRLLKSGRREHQYGLFIGSTVGGGLALMLGVLLFATVCAMFYGTTASISNMAAMDAWLPLLDDANANWNYMLVSSLLAFVFGMVWSGVGLAISVYSPNRYVSYLTPFIICFCSVLVLPINLQPLEMLVQMNWTTFTFPKLLTYQFILYIAALVWFMCAFERRIVHEQD